MRRCGLNDATLSDPGASVGKVVEYLEVLYVDDPVVLHTTAIPKAWHAGRLELKATSWTVSIFNAQNDKAKPDKRAVPLLAPLDATGVAGSLQAFEAAAARVGAATTDQARSTALKEAILAAERLQVAFFRLKPRRKDDPSKDHAEVKDYVDALNGQCTMQLRDWEAALTTLEADLAKAEAERQTGAGATSV